MVADVPESHLAVLPVVDGLVVRDPVRNAEEAPPADEGTGVDGVAARVDQRHARSGRQVGRRLEPREVERDPGRDEHQRGERHDPDPLESPAPIEARHRERDRQCKKREEEHAFGSREREEPDAGAERRGAPRRRGAPKRVCGEQHQRRDQREQRLQEHDCVVDPQVGVEGRDPAREQPGPVPRQPSAEEPDGTHRRGPDHARGDAVGQE